MTWYPMMWKAEVRAIERILLACPSDVIEILEWGSGGSTVYFTQFLKKHGRNYKWTSLEYNQCSWDAYPSGRLVTMRLWAGSLTPATLLYKYFAKLQNSFKLAALSVVYALIRLYESVPVLRRIKRTLI